MAPCINDDGVRIRPGQSADDADDVSAVAMTGQTNANATMAVSGVEERFIEDEARQQVPLSRVRNNGEGAERGRCYGCRSVIFVTSINIFHFLHWHMEYDKNHSYDLGVLSTEDRRRRRNY